MRLDMVWYGLRAMNFQVPQFIEIEDKIFGPLSLKQFLYVAGGGALSFIIYVYLPLYLAILPIVVVFGLALLMAFYKYNDRPFIVLLESAFRYSLTHKLYIWKKGLPRPAARAPAAAPSAAPATGRQLPRLSQSRLKDLAWSLDVKDLIR